MADRVSASIVIGGTLTASAYAEIAEIIADEGLSIEWDGAQFEPDHRTFGEPLSLYAHEVAWGRFEELEAWCVENKLAFSRWSGGYGSQWGPERVVFTGQGEPMSCATDEDDYIVIGRGTVEKLGSIEAILAYFDAANVAIPPLVVEDEASSVPSPKSESSCAMRRATEQ